MSLITAIDRAWHRSRGMMFLSEEECEADPGTRDFDCNCLLCRGMGRY